MKETVREYYAARATALPRDETPPSLGLGDPVALAALREGETVLDLGSGPGRDLLAAAHAVGETGRAIGVDMTPEMRERAADAARAAGLSNVSIVDGDLERLPFPCASVDVVISNCVINLVPDKRRALTEAYRVLVPGGRLALIDTAFDVEPPAEVRDDPNAWCGCVGGALVADDYVRTLEDIGFSDVRLDHLDASCGASCSTGDAVEARSVAVTARKSGEPGTPVRPAVRADRAAIDALLQAESLDTATLRTEDTFVALGDGGVAGAVALERYGPAALLRSLVVAPPRRREGIGSRLVIAALEAARWSGADEVFLLTPETQRFFERIGFVPISRKRAGVACASEQFASAECESAVAMRLAFEDAGRPLGRPSRKELPTFQDGACC